MSELKEKHDHIAHVPIVQTVQATIQANGSVQTGHHHPKAGLTEIHHEANPSVYYQAETQAHVEVTAVPEAGHTLLIPGLQEIILPVGLIHPGEAIPVVHRVIDRHIREEDTNIFCSIFHNARKGIY